MFLEQKLVTKFYKNLMIPDPPPLQEQFHVKSSVNHVNSVNSVNYVNSVNSVSSLKRGATSIFDGIFCYDN